MLKKIHIIGSSSSGNTYLLYFSNGKVIQLDAGCKVDGATMKLIDTLFITHYHSDHVKFLKDYQKQSAVKEGFQIVDPNTGIDPKGYNTEWFSTEVPHAVPNYGYVIREDNELIGYITDCGDYEQMNLDLSKLTYLFVECNWDYFLINQGIIIPQEHSVYSFSKKGHMSNLACLNALAKWKVNKNCKIIFIHKSSGHARYESTYKMFDSLPNDKFVAKDGDMIYIKGDRTWKKI